MRRRLTIHSLVKMRIAADPFSIPFCSSRKKRQSKESGRVSHPPVGGHKLFLANHEGSRQMDGVKSANGYRLNMAVTARHDRVELCLRAGIHLHNSDLSVSDVPINLALSRPDLPR